MHEDSCSGVQSSLKMKLQVVVSYLGWVLGVKLSSSGRKASALNHQAISLALSFDF